MSVPIRSPLTDHCAACQLKSHAFFCDLPKTTMDDFESIKRSTAYPAHSLLFMEGEAPRGIFLLCHGRAKLYMTSAQGKMLLLRFADGLKEVLVVEEKRGFMEVQIRDALYNRPGHPQVYGKYDEHGNKT